MMAGFKTGHIGVTVLFLLLMALIFAGMVYYASRMVFGAAPARYAGARSRRLVDGRFVPAAGDHRCVRCVCTIRIQWCCTKSRLFCREAIEDERTVACLSAGSVNP